MTGPPLVVHSQTFVSITVQSPLCLKSCQSSGQVPLKHDNKNTNCISAAHPLTEALSSKLSRFINLFLFLNYTVKIKSVVPLHITFTHVLQYVIYSVVLPLYMPSSMLSILLYHL